MPPIVFVQYNASRWVELKLQWESHLAQSEWNPCQWKTPKLACEFVKMTKCCNAIVGIMERVYPETHGHIVHIFGICITKRELPSPHLLKSSQGLANRVPAVQIAIHCSHFMGVSSLQVNPIQFNIMQWGFILVKRYICMVYVLWRRYHALLHGRQWIILANLER